MCVGLWNQVFLGCNLSLFLLLPFAYFFVESEGMAGWRKVGLPPPPPPPTHTHTHTHGMQGLVSRVCETVILLGLLAAMALVLTWLFSALLLSLLADYEVRSSLPYSVYTGDKRQATGHLILCIFSAVILDIGFLNPILSLLIISNISIGLCLIILF